MNESTPHLPEPDLIDRIARALPADVRADYYREMTHCRSLPENDEMLRILRAILFLALLMEQVPNRMVTEREKFESVFRGALEGLHQTLASVLEYHSRLDARLAELPEDIASGISPDAIAGCINESLRQQFTASTIPETARALALVARNIKTTTAEFGRTAAGLGDAYRGSAAAARRAIGDMESVISRAAGSARRAADDLTITFHRTYRWVLCALSSFALLAGILFGMLLFRYLRPQPEAGKAVTSAPQPAPRAGHPDPPARVRNRKSPRRERARLRIGDPRCLRRAPGAIQPAQPAAG